MNALQVLNFFTSKTVWAFFCISGDGRSTATVGELLRQDFAKRLMLTNRTGVRRQGTACAQKRIKVLLPSSSVGSTVSNTDKSEESIANVGFGISQECDQKELVKLGQFQHVLLVLGTIV